MLPARHRMRRRGDFSTTIRRGRRASAGRVAVHASPSSDLAADGTGPVAGPPVVGFVVSRAVGSAVDRNLVRRRLRALMAQRLGRLSPGSRVVVRALPAAAGATSAVLGADLDRALHAATRTSGARAERAGGGRGRGQQR